MTRTNATESVNPTHQVSGERSSFRLPMPPDLVERTCPFTPPTGLEQMRKQSPVTAKTMLNGRTVWMVTGHAEARTVLSDFRFSADRVFGATIQDAPEHLRERLFDKRMRAGSFITMDPPEHTRLRKLLTGQFTVRRMRQLHPRIEEIVTEHLDAMLAAGTTADLVTDFALPVPSLVICELLGVPYADRAEFQHRTATLLNLDKSFEEVIQARDEMRAFLRRLVTQKRSEPSDDMLSGLIHNGGADPALAEEELVGIANLLLVAGHETTANMLALGTFALLEHPDQLEALRADPSLIDNAVEELLRHLSIVHLGITRVTTEEVELGGQTIPAEATVMIAIPAANRDSQQWSDASDLDITRERSPHLAFGHGVHQCLGQQLARVEMTVGFTHLLRRLPNLRLTVPAEDVPLRTTMAVYGVHSLPVAWDSPEEATT